MFEHPAVDPQNTRHSSALAILFRFSLTVAAVAFALLVVMAVVREIASSVPAQLVEGMR